MKKETQSKSQQNKNGYSKDDIEKAKKGTWVCVQKMSCGSFFVNIGDSFSAKELYSKYPALVEDIKLIGGAWECWLDGKKIKPIFPYPSPHLIG